MLRRWDAAPVRQFVLGSLNVARRWARRRGTQATVIPKAETEGTLEWVTEEDGRPVADVTALRSGGMNAAPCTTSLDRIRAEVQWMRREAAEKAQAGLLKRKLSESVEVKSNPGARKATLAGLGGEADRSPPSSEVDQLIYSQLRARHKPDDAYYAGSDVAEHFEERLQLQRRGLFNDADEVLRCRKKEDTVRYMKLAFSRDQLHGADEDATLRVVNDVLKRIETEKERLSEERREIYEGQEQSSSPGRSEYRLSEEAVVNVLDGMTDAELRTLNDLGLLDLEMIAAAEDGGSETVGEGPEGALVSTGNSAAVGAGVRLASESSAQCPLASPSGAVPVDRASLTQTEVATHTTGEGGESEEREDTAATPASLKHPFEDALEQFSRLGYLHALTTAIRDTTLGGVPTIDLAPALLKVQRHQEGEITQNELRRLEDYEEAKRTLQVMVSAQPVEKGVGTRLAEVDVTDALLDHALLPSNRFLHAVAQKDERVRRSLEVLERVKRESLLDPAFQSALRVVHVSEEESVGPYVRGDSVDNQARRVLGEQQGGAHEEGDDDDEVSTALRGGGGRGRPIPLHERRALRRNLLQGPKARPYHAADVPFFFNNVRSFVPPRGHFNLPSPALSREEQAALRGRRRRQGRGNRFFSR